MSTVWKFPIEITESQSISMPNAAAILSAQSQNEQLCLWALVDPAADTEVPHLRVCGTAHPIARANDLKHLGSVQMHGGSLVFHVFEDIVAAAT